MRYADLDPMTSTRASMDSLLDLAARAREPRELLEGTLATLHPLIGFEIAFYVGRAGGLAPAVVTWGADPQHLGALLMTAQTSFKQELSPVKEAALARRGVATDTEVLGARRAARTAYHRHVAAPAGAHVSMLCFPRVRGEVLGSLVLGRASPFREGEQRSVEHLLPAIGLGLSSFGDRRPPASTSRRLTPREREIVDYLCLGHTNRSIAIACGTSVNTVRNQLARIFEKLEVASRAELVARALRP